MGQTARVMSWAHAAVPRLYDRLVPCAVERAALRAEAVEPGPGNVFEPMPDWNRVTGQWRARRWRLLRRAGLAAGAGVGSVALWRARRPRGRKEPDRNDSRGEGGPL